MKATLTSLQRKAFVDGMPRPLKLRRMLNLRPFENLVTENIRLDGPSLMWGQTIVSSGERIGEKPIWYRAARAIFNFFKKNAWAFALAWGIAFFMLASPLFAQSWVPNLRNAVAPAETPEDVTSSIELLLLLTVLTLAPSIIIMMTSFTRLIIVFGFIRMALGTQQLPPTQVLTGMALILTFLIMRPHINDIKDNALVPYLDAQITQAEAFDNSLNTMRNFMLSQVARDDLIMFGRLSGIEDLSTEWKSYNDIDTFTLIPAFVTSELKRGFYMGFMLYLPFFIIDLMVATVLISMGMLVLPPVLISMPFKLLLFVLVDGWGLIVRSLVKSFVPSVGAG